MRPVERHGKEEAQRRDQAVDRGRLYPDLALLHLIPANILGLRRIGRPPEERCEAAHTANIIVLRMRPQAAHRHVFQHALPQRTREATPSRSRLHQKRTTSPAAPIPRSGSVHGRKADLDIAARFQHSFAQRRAGEYRSGDVLEPRTQG